MLKGYYIRALVAVGVSLLSASALQAQDATAPAVAWSSYLGGSYNDEVYGTSIDDQGNILCCGVTLSSDFPTPGGFDTVNNRGADGYAFVAKLSPSGMLLWGSYLGGSSDSYARSLCHDAAGNVYVAGSTRSSDLPVANGFDLSFNGGFYDSYILKISPAGQVIAGTYYGGDGQDHTYCVRIGPDGSVYLSGSTGSTNLPVTGGYDQTYNGGNDGYRAYGDGFLAKFDADMQLQWATYLGGAGAEGINGIAPTADGGVIAVGNTTSPDFPLVNAFRSTFASSEGYAAKFDAAGNLQWSSFIGGSNEDCAYGTALTSTGDIVVAGYTTSSDLVGAESTGTTFGGQKDAFAALISEDGTLQWNRYIGGTYTDVAGHNQSVLVDDHDLIYVAGQTDSTELPLAVNTLTGSYDAYLACMAASSELQWTIYLGGTGVDYGVGLAGADGRVYVAGYTQSSNLPAGINTNAGHSDGFLVAVTLPEPPDTTPPAITAYSPTDPALLPVSEVSVTFSEAIDPATFTVEDVSVTGPLGAVAVTAVELVAGDEYKISFEPQTYAGNYTIAVGPTIADVAGNLLDINGDGICNSADIYSFTVKAVTDTAITQDTTIAADDDSYDGTDLCVDGVTVTIDGPHSFNSIQIINGGVITHTAGSAAGIKLTVAGDVFIDAGSSINVDGKGYAGGQGPGAGDTYRIGDKYIGAGAGHGGSGGNVIYSNLVYAGGASYDSLFEPAMPGSGGGGADFVAGGSGGGIATLEINGSLHLDGTISADGFGGRYLAYSRYSAGGSGGSICLTASAIEGEGTIDASGGGGDGYIGYAGAGAGGRIALYYSACAFTGGITAQGGAAQSSGAAGTIFFKPADSAGWLVIDNLGRQGTVTSVPDTEYEYETVDVAGYAVCEVVTGQLACRDALTIRGNGRLIVAGTGSVAAPTVTVTESGQLHVKDQGAIASPLVEVAAGSMILDTALSLNALHIADGGMLTHTAGQNAFDLTVTGDLVIDEGGQLSVDGRGYASASGPGAGSTLYANDRYIGSGGGHGGCGGDGVYRSYGYPDTLGPGGGSYGSLTEPVAFGSGGGNAQHIAGGAGGGSARLTVNGVLTLNGTVSANGIDGRYSAYSRSSGGGAGGSVYIAAETIQGTGSLAADGGDGDSVKRGGAGAGGRIALYYSASAYTGSISAHGGGAMKNGGAGTIFIKPAGSAGTLIIDNKGIAGAQTPVADDGLTFSEVVAAGNAVVAKADGAITADSIFARSGGKFLLSGTSVLQAPSVAAEGGYFEVGGQAQIVSDITSMTEGGSVHVKDTGQITSPAGVEVSAGGTFIVDTAVSLDYLHVADGGTVTHTAAQTGFDLTVTGDLTVDAGGTISADGKGYAGGQGPGTGTDLTTQYAVFGSGAGYGGSGGIGYYRNSAFDTGYRETPGGDAYGSVLEPISLGSGGGTAGAASGGAGGGRIRLTVGGTFLLNGSVSTAATGGYYTRSGIHCYSGGGSGGSVFVNAGTLSGDGSISSKGGDGSGSQSGAGAGGRIAVYYESSTFTGTYSARGGAGSKNGAAGTIFIKPADSAGTLIIDNEGITGAQTPIAGDGSFREVVVAGNAVVSKAECSLISDQISAESGGEFLLTGTATLQAPAIAANGSYFGVAGQAQIIADSISMADGGVVHVQENGQIPGRVEVAAGGTLIVDTSISLNYVHVADGGTVTHTAGQNAFDLTVTGDMVVDAGGAVSADAKGYPSSTGPGKGGDHMNADHAYAAGAGYGGKGGDSDYATGGVTYGSYEMPIDLGSGGGRTDHTNGGAGGGCIRLTVNATLTLNGIISAKGQDGAARENGYDYCYSGGGSGGSILLTVQNLQGSGGIVANGGNGYSNVSGAGGGGRIAVYHRNIEGFNIESIAVSGGIGKSAGADGTVYLRSYTGSFVRSSEPNGYIGRPVSCVNVTFGGPIQADTLTVDDLTLPNTILRQDVAINLLQGNTYRIAFPEQSADGQYEIVIGPHISDSTGQEMDQNGNGVPGEPDDSYRLRFTIDTTAPVTELVAAPAQPDGFDGWYITQPQITLTASDAGIGVKQIVYWWNDAAATTVEGDIVEITAPAGANVLHYYAVDEFGQAEIEQTSAEIKVDDSTPMVSIDLSGPTGGDGWYSGDVAATVTADGAGVELASVEYNHDNARWQAYADPVVITGEGSHRVTARATTVRGKTAEASQTFVIDVNPPSTTFAISPAQPNGLDGWYITQPQVTLSATDTGGVKEIHYWWNADVEQIANGNTATIAVPTGGSVLHYYAVDVYGRTETEQTSAEIRYDGSDPTVAIDLAGAIGGDGWYSGDVTATVTADGSGVELASVEYNLDSAGWQVYADPVAITGEGSHTITARVTTIRGKIAEASQSFVIDINPPTTEFVLSPAQPNGLDGWYISQPEVRLSASDVGGGVKEIHYWWNSDAEQIAPGNSATIAVPAGTSILHYYAVDICGRSEAEQTSAEIRYDGSTPTVSIDLAGPAGDEGWFDGDVAATVTADGAGIEVALLEVSIEGGAWTAYTGLVAFTGECGHSIAARMRTATGKAASASKSFVIDTQPPVSVATTEPLQPNGENGWFIIDAPRVSISAVDAVGTVHEVHYRWNDGPENIIYGSSAQIVAPEGDNILSFFAVDNHNHVETEQQLPVKFNPEKPDLIVESVQLSTASARFGDQINVTYTVRNIGAVTAPDVWTDVISLDGGAMATCGGILKISPAGQLGAGKTYTKTATVTLPIKECYGQGSYSIKVETDFTDSEAETNEQNNAATSEMLDISLPPLPDLQVADIFTAPSGFVNQTSSLTWLCTNSGDEFAEGPWIDSVYLSEDDTLGGDTLIGSYEYTGSLATGAGYQQHVDFTLPQVPGSYWIIITTDARNSVREHTGEENNTRTSVAAINVKPYNVTAGTEITTALAGTEVPIAGRASGDDGTPAGGVPVSVRVLHNGSRRTTTLTTDATGGFSTVFKPLSSEAGLYQIAADRPDISVDTVQDEFLLLGMRPSTRRVQAVFDYGTVATGEITMQNLSDVPLTQLNASVSDAAANMNVQITAGDTLPGNGSIKIGYSVSARDESTLYNSPKITVTSAEGATVDFWIDISVRPLMPNLVAQPGSLSGSMLRGTTTVVNVTATNTGAAPTGDLRVMLPIVPWLQLASPASISSLAPGASTTVILLLTPDENLMLGKYNGTVVLAGDSCNLSVPFEFTAVSDSIGGLKIAAEDEFTYYADGNPRIAGAQVTITDHVTGSIVNSGETDAGGQISFSGLTEAYYDIRITAAEHSTYTATVLVPAGGTKTIDAFLPRELVSYNWSVVPTTVEDRYSIVVESEFKTDVPAPVITVEPSVIDLSQLKDAVNQVNITITNHGLVAAEGMALEIGEHPDYEIMTVGEEIGRLAAKSSIQVPVIITRLAGDEQRAHAASLQVAENVAPCSVQGDVHWYVPCGKDDKHYAQTVSMINASENCTGVTSPSSPSSNWDSGSGGTSSGSGSYTTTRGSTAASPYVSAPSVEVGNPCDNVLPCLEAFAQCIIGFLPGSCATSSILGIVNTYRACNTLSLSCAYTAATSIVSVILSCAGDTVGKPFTIAWGIVSCIQGIADACFPVENDPALAAALRAQGITEEDFALLKQQADRLEQMLRGVVDLFGDEAWLMGNADEAPIFNAWLQAFLDATAPETDGGYSITAAERSVLLAMQYPSQLSPEQVNAFLNRWNVTIANWQAGNFDAAEGISFARMQDEWQQAGEAAAANIADGYESLFDGIDEVTVRIMQNQAESVCARVRIHLDQEAVISRSAFLATLEIVNGSSSLMLENIAVTLKIEDAAGQAATDLFGIRAPRLTALTAVDGTGSIASNSTGRAEWTIIPTRDAAPEEPAQYFVSGEVLYTYGGEQLTIPLFKESITVLPDPLLTVKYFHARDVVSDDPFTEPVEPAVPFSLGMIMTNSGKGTARNVRITSAQPTIVENEKGLLIDYKIIGTQVGDQQVSPSLAVNLGDIGPGESKVAQWLMTSSLQGQFVDYNASFEHIDGLGDPRLSLIDNVEVHELVHVVRADADGLPDFLVNDTPDGNGIADAIHLSDGSVAPVVPAANAAAEGSVTPDTLTILVNADMPAGWGYMQTADPGNADYKLVQVLREDGQPVPTENAWLTHRTERPEGEPEYEVNLLHILDLDGTASYTVTYEVDLVASDDTAPTSSVNALPARSASKQFEVAWNGLDGENGSGVSCYNIYVSTDGGAFQPWLERTELTGAIFTGSEETTYAFYSVAVDAAGNAEAAPETADASIYVPDMTPPPISMRLAASSDSGTAGDNLTNVTTPTFAGITEPLATVTLDIIGPDEYTLAHAVKANPAGSWSYTLTTEQALPDGTATASASAMDEENNVSTEAATVSITIDTQPPTATVQALPAESARMFKVDWSGTDATSSIASYSIYAAQDGGQFEPWLSNTAKTSAWFTGEIGTGWRFYAVATDAAGNAEAPAVEAEAQTTIGKLWPIEGDTNLDCKVSIIDLIYIRNRLNKSPAEADNWQADVNNDGKINIIDLIYVRNRLNNSCE